MGVLPQTSAGYGVRTLEAADLPAVRQLLRRDPVDNVYVASRIRSAGVDPMSLGHPVWGYERAGRLQALLHAGSNMVPVGADRAACAAFAAHAGPQRTASSIIGPAPAALAFYEELSHRWGPAWADAREVRADQPLMMIDDDPVVAPDPRVRQVDLDVWHSYADAAVAMYTEEVGVSPAINGSDASYRVYIRSLIQQGRSFGVVQDRRVVFKADIGSATSSICQIQGVWVHPELRGQGMAAPCMAAVVRLARRRWPVVSLYVNDFNAAALATYRRIGMRTVGTFATVLY